MEGPLLARDPVLRTLVSVAVGLLGFFALGVGGDRVQVIVGWLALLGTDAALFVLARRVARMPETAAAPRRFWWAAATAAAVFGVGDSFQLGQILLRPASDGMTPGAVQSVATLVGTAAMVAATLCYPTGLGSGRARVRFLLDAATTMTAFAVVSWCLVTRSAVAEADALVTAVFGSGLIMAGVFAAVKLSLSGASPMSVSAALPMLAAAGIQGLATTVLPTRADSAPLSWQLILLVGPSFLFLLGPRIHALQVRHNRGVSRRQQRHRYSVLPYSATLVTFAALVAVLLDSGLAYQAWGALVGLVINVALVVVRQVLALAENARLLDKLDESLLEITLRERRLDSLVRHSSDITSITDRRGRLAYVSPALRRTLGLEVAEIVGRRMIDFLHPDDLAGLHQQLTHLVTTVGATLTYQTRFSHADGSWRWLEVIATNLVGEPGIDGVVANARDVTETRELHERLRHQADHDPLTGLANRRLFAERMRAVEHCRAAVLLIDLDGFKWINDTHGHHTGDEVLLFVAARLREAAGADDVVARLGGDEFAVLVPAGDELAARRVADRFLDQIALPALIDGRTIAVRASVGMVVGDAADDLIHAADLKMYEAKRLRAARREA
ncbi:diguanylate cyclase domain-containing protein [Actinoplanes sp. NPDC049599]|uniref:diguanylate cyclase domain-containing protein n=1 Tax=Actinoplanes sp. NPDC049599 TaxID=3363903 RepID=UPI0037BB30D7